MIWILIIAAIVVFVLFKAKNRSQSHSSGTSSITNHTHYSDASSSIASAQNTWNKFERDSVSSLYSRFFSAVNQMREPNGTGNVMVNRNAQNGTVKIYGHYCNYECLDCSHRIASYLSYPGFSVMGSDAEDRDNVHFELDEVSCTDSEFGVQTITQALYSSLPNVSITGQTSRDDFCSVQFKT